MIAALAALGVFVAVPLTGRLALGSLGLPIPKIAWPSLWVAIGLAIWSVPLLITAEAGLYSPALFGTAGWIAAITIAIWLMKRGVARLARPHLPRWDWVVLAGIAAAALLAAAFPADPITATRDQGTYASEAIYLAHHGSLAIPYPNASGITEPTPSTYVPFVHLNDTQPTMTAPFSHLFPAWLAQTFSAAGYDAFMRMNVVLGLLCLLVIYGLAIRFLRRPFAAVAVILLAFNPAEIWSMRQTLSETLAELLIWCGLLLLVASLVRRDPRRAIWAGVLLGMSPVVHIDAVLVLPFIVIAHAAIRVLPRAHSSQQSIWRYFYSGALPSFLLSLAYYFLFSQPYLLGLGSVLPWVILVCVAAFLALGATYVRGIARSIQGMLDRRSVVIVGLVGLGLAATYGFFIRPLIVPYATINAPGAPWDGSRSYDEEALVNLARYLTPGVVWAALLGFSILVIRVVEKRAWSALAPLLAVALGFTVVYCWQQSVAPVHFWAIRRFVPVVIPSLIIFASLAAQIATRWLSHGGQRFAFAAVTIFLFIYTARIGVPTYTISERSGSYQAMSRFANTIPSGHVLALGDYWDSAQYWMPLYVAFDRAITPVDITTPEGWSETVSRLRSASTNNPLAIISVRATPPAPVTGAIASELTFPTTTINEVVTPVPVTSQTSDVTLSMIQASGLDTLGAGLVNRPQWMVLIAGMYGQRHTADSVVQGTSGDATIIVPIDGDLVPDTLSISIADTGPTGGPLEIRINDIAVFKGQLPAGQWSDRLSIPSAAGLALGGSALIEIISNTYEPDPTLGYLGPVGVELSHLSLERSGP